MTTQEFYHGKEYNSIVIGLSAAATWTWAPALILSSDIAANKGIIGMMSFIIPNILALWLFAMIGQRMSPLTLWESPLIRSIFHLGYGAVEFFCVLIQVTAGSNVLQKAYGIPYHLSVLIFLGMALFLSYRKGLHGTIISNKYEQVCLIVFSCFLAVTAFHQQGSTVEIKNGVFSLKDTILYTLILFSGPIMTNQHWQRAEKRGYLWAGILFGLPLFCIASIGLFSGVSGEYVSFQIFTSPTSKGILVLMVMSGLFSTLQSSFTSIISIFGGEETLLNARIKMSGLAFIALAIILMNINLLTLWTSMGIFRVVLAIGVLIRLYVYQRRSTFLFNPL